MLDARTAPPLKKSVTVSSNATYVGKRNNYYSRLEREKSEFNNAIQKICDAEQARLKNETVRVEARAHTRYKIFKAFKTIAFLLPIVLSVFTGIELFSKKSFYDELTNVPYLFFWVVFAIGTIVASVFLIKSLNKNEIYYNKDEIKNAKRYSLLSLAIVGAVASVAILFISLISAIPETKGDFVFAKRGGEYYLTGYLGNSSTINLPDDYNGQPYHIANKAFKDNQKIREITIGKSVISIGESAFKDCTYIELINFNATNMKSLGEDNRAFTNAGWNGEGITVKFGKDVVEIPDYLFYSYYTYVQYSSDKKFPKLVNVVFEEGSACERIGKRAFSPSLKTVTIPESVTEIDYLAFSSSIISSLSSATFENPNGWSAGKVQINPEDLKNQSTAAYYLGKYSKWTRN